VLVPGLAASPTGMRLGRGGGSYDRALGRVPVGTFTCALLYDDEVDRDVPTEPHDRAVSAVATPSGIRRFQPSGG
jgi:5-formyltetrahydrofolate cyclo-ligase